MPLPEVSILKSFRDPIATFSQTYDSEYQSCFSAAVCSSLSPNVVVEARHWGLPPDCVQSQGMWSPTWSVWGSSCDLKWVIHLPVFSDQQCRWVYDRCSQKAPFCGDRWSSATPCSQGFGQQVHWIWQSQEQDQCGAFLFSRPSWQWCQDQAAIRGEWSWDLEQNQNWFWKVWGSEDLFASGSKPVSGVHQVQDLVHSAIALQMASS